MLGVISTSGSGWLALILWSSPSWFSGDASWLILTAWSRRWPSWEFLLLLNVTSSSTFSDVGIFAVDGPSRKGKNPLPVVAVFERWWLLRPKDVPSTDLLWSSTPLGTPDVSNCRHRRNTTSGKWNNDSDGTDGSAFVLGMEASPSTGNDQEVSGRDGSIPGTGCGNPTGTGNEDADALKDCSPAYNGDDLRSPAQTGRSRSPPWPEVEIVGGRGTGRKMEGESSERHWRRRWRANNAAVGKDVPHMSQISRRRQAARMRRCRHRLLNCVYDLRQTSQRNGFSTATFLLSVSSPTGRSCWVARASWNRPFSPEVAFLSSSLTKNGSCCGLEEKATRPDITGEFCKITHSYDCNSDY